MNCFGYDGVKGCSVLNYNHNDLENGRCNGCKFKRTVEQHQIDKLVGEEAKKNPKSYNFLLAIDGANSGTYHSIAEIDDKLKIYYAEHQEEENANAKSNSNFIDDYNLMYENHDIRIIRM